MKLKFIFLVGVILAISYPVEAWEKTYTFRYKNSINFITLNLNETTMSKCKQSTSQWQKTKGTLSSYKRDGYSKYVNDYPCDWLVENLILKIDEFLENNNIQFDTNKEKIDFFIAFVNGVPYQYDIKSWGESDYFQTPFQTLFLNKGDCEDHAFLLSQMLKLSCMKNIIIDMPGHIAVGIDEDVIDDPDEKNFYSIEYKNHDYYYCEATRDKFCPTCYYFRVGQNPDGKEVDIEKIELIYPACN